MSENKDKIREILEAYDGLCMDSENDREILVSALSSQLMGDGPTMLYVTLHVNEHIFRTWWEQEHAERECWTDDIARLVSRHLNVIPGCRADIKGRVE